MKVLVIHSQYLERGGEDEVVNAEVKLLLEHGHKVILYKKSNEHIENLLFFRKLFFILSELIFSKAVYKELKEIIKKEKPDIAHVHNIFFSITPSAYVALKEEGVPIIQSLHNYRFFCLRGALFNKGSICEICNGRPLYHSVMKKCWRNSYLLSFLLSCILYRWRSILKNNVDSYIVLSEFSRNKFNELGLKGHNVYLKTNFLATEPEEDIGDHGYALFIGRLVDYKGVGTLIKAFNIKPSFDLKIIGDGPMREEVSSFASSRNNVEFLGSVAKKGVIRALKNSSFLIFPSECYENMPMVIIESLGFSKPVLASSLGAVNELIINGTNGILFEPGNAEDLAAKISYLFSHKKEREIMGKNANNIYRTCFDKEKNYCDLMDIYEKTIRKKRNDYNIQRSDRQGIPRKSSEKRMSSNENKNQ